MPSCPWYWAYDCWGGWYQMTEQWATTSLQKGYGWDGCVYHRGCWYVYMLIVSLSSLMQYPRHRKDIPNAAYHLGAICDIQRPRMGYCHIEYFSIKIKDTVVARRYQVLCLFWPIYLISCSPDTSLPSMGYKSQSQTLDKVVIDLQKSFADSRPLPLMAC